MPFSKLHRKRKTRESQQKHRQESLMLCPCLLCLNRVQLRESDVNKHIEHFGLADESVSSEGSEERDMQENSFENNATIQEGSHSMPCSSSQIKEPPLKETKLSSLDETSSSESSVSRRSLSAGIACDDGPSDRCSPSSAITESTASPSSENSDWVIPEKIHTSPTDGILEILTGGGVKDSGNPGGRGG